MKRTSTGTDPFAQALALKGAAMIDQWLRKAVAQPQNLEARSNMLVASMFGDYALIMPGSAQCTPAAIPWALTLE